MTNDVAYMTVGAGHGQRNIGVRRREGAGPGVIWLGGFTSDMKGTKAQALDDWAAKHGRALVRFDYSGHGESSGNFAEGTIGLWLEEALAVFTAHCHGPQIVVGSSMGGWIALLLIREFVRCHAVGRAAPIVGLVLIAPAVDFTEELIWKRCPPSVRHDLETKGAWFKPSQYGEQPLMIRRTLIEEGRQHLLFGGLIEAGCPVRILQGVKDPDVPWQHAVDLVARLAQDDVVLTLVKDGDHRLSRPEDIERMLRVIAEF
jgi:pimeloyl-ACP methyl ester carboxylesterase